MFKTLVTLLRGAAAAAEEEVVDRNALLILDQQIRDAAGAVERGKRALAIAIVQDDAERKRIESISARIADLEERAVAALAAGREGLAAEAAEAIVAMENDRAAVPRRVRAAPTKSRVCGARSPISRAASRTSIAGAEPPWPPKPLGG